MTTEHDLCFASDEPKLCHCEHDCSKTQVCNLWDNGCLGLDGLAWTNPVDAEASQLLLAMHWDENDWSDATEICNKKLVDEWEWEGTSRWTRGIKLAWSLSGVSAIGLACGWQVEDWKHMHGTNMSYMKCLHTWRCLQLPVHGNQKKETDAWSQYVLELCLLTSLPLPLFVP